MSTDTTRSNKSFNLHRLLSEVLDGPGPRPQVIGSFKDLYVTSYLIPGLAQHDNASDESTVKERILKLLFQHREEKGTRCLFMASHSGSPRSVGDLNDWIANA